MATWTLDPAHTTIGFTVKHLGISTVRGAFGEFSGSLEAADDTFAGAIATFSAKAASVDTRNAMRDGHLRSADFFDAENHPEITFVSKPFPGGTGTFSVTGDLTMRGTTREVTLSVTFGGIGVGIDGARVASFEIKGTVSRKDFGLTYSAMAEGIAVVSDEVAIDILAEAKPT